MPEDFIRSTEKEIKTLKEMLSALDNENRIIILEMLMKRQRDESGRYRSFEKYTLNVDEIRDQLEKRDINLTDQMIRNHLKKLIDVGLVGIIRTDEDMDGNPLRVPVNSYYFNIFAFDSLLFENQVFLEEIRSFMFLYGNILESQTKYDCVIKVFTGIDKDKELKLKHGQTGYIGRDAAYNPDKYGPESLILSSQYETVTRLHKPHLKIFDEDGEWYIMDHSTHGTFIDNKQIKKDTPVKIPNNTFIHLSKGLQSVVLFVSYKE